MLTELFPHRSVHDVLRDMDAARAHKACIVGKDMRTHYGVQMVTDEDLPALTALYPDRLVHAVDISPEFKQKIKGDMRRRCLGCDRDRREACHGFFGYPGVQHRRFG